MSTPIELVSVLPDAKDSSTTPNGEDEKVQNPEAISVDVGPVAVSPNGYLMLLSKFRSLWQDCPDVHIQFRDISYTVSVPVVDRGIRSFLAQGFDALKRLNFLKKINKKWGPKTKKLEVLGPSSGCILPGTMTLVLTPPGHGKSTFLRGLSGRLQGDRHFHGEVLYNGMTASQALSKGTHISRLVALVGQEDTHFPVLTTFETLDFAAKTSCANIELLTKDPELIAMDRKRAELMISMLGLDECANTVIGNDLLRGVSGGQRKRVTLGEMLITNSRVLFLDEVSTGLDAAVTFHIFHALQQWTQSSRGSIVAALLQPTPEVYELFSHVLLMREGDVVYHGPREGVKPFFAQHFGVPIPNDVEEGGFIVDYLNNPRRLVAHLVKELSDKEGSMDGKEPESLSPNGSVLAPALPVVLQVHKAGQKHEQTILPGAAVLPALTTPDLIQRYHASPAFAAMEKETSDSLERCKADPKLHFDPSQWCEFTKKQFASRFSHPFLYYLKLDNIRQAHLTFRNKQIFIPRLFQAVLMGFIFSTLFFQLSPTNYQSRFGLLLYCTMFGAFANLSELPIAAEARNVVTKQLDATFYPAQTFILSNVVWSIPKIIVEVIIFGTLMYFVTGFVYEPGNYFFFLFMLFSSSFALSVFFRTISFVTPNPDVARQMDFPFILIFVIFSGFLILYSKIPVWLIEFYWLNPLQWAVTALALNEFKSSRYDHQAANSTSRQGDVYLQFYDMTTNQAYEWASIGYLYGFFFVFVVISGAALAYVRGVRSLGTKRLGTDKKSGKSHKNGNEPASVEVSVSRSAVGAHPGAPTAATHGTIVPLSSVDVSVTATAAVGSDVSKMPFTPVYLVWEDIKYTVMVKQHGLLVPRVLLQSISGYSKPGTMTALMGSSGAGKTTLLDVVGGRKTVGMIEGRILVNGQEVSPWIFNRLTGYVEQQDLHMGLTTVREALDFSARLRLPRSVTDTSRAQWIEVVMRLVGLHRIGDRLVGDAANPGLSPGQLKLLTIGVELVANPSVLFLDEPTSGLDAPSALRVMQCVRRIADTGRSVVCTIHQPSSELFFMFDRLLLLRSGGEEVFFSDIGENGKLLVQYFETVGKGKAPSCPKNQNPANWMLDVIGAGVASAEGGSIQAAGFQYADYVGMWKHSDLHQRAAQETAEFSKPSPDRGDVTHVANLEYASYWTRFYEVQKRYFVMHWRNGPSNLTRVLLLLIIGLLFGLIYLQIFPPSDFQGVISTVAVVFMGLAFPSSVSAASAFPSFFRQRAVYYRESTIQMYDYKIYSTAMLIVEIPYVFFCLAFFIVPFYFMVGLRPTGDAFFKYYLVVFIMGILYSSISQLWLALAPSPIASNIMNGLTMSMFFMFGGLFIPKDSMPVAWLWFYYIDPIPKALIAASAPQFDCSGTDVCPSITVLGCANLTTISSYVDNFIAGNASQYGEYIGWLFLTFFVVRVFIFLGFRNISHLKR